MTAVLNPATEEVIAEIEAAGVEETDAAVARAKGAFPAWRAVAPAFPTVLWRRVDQRFGLFGGEERHGAWLKALGWDAEHPPDHGGMLGVPDGGVGEQGSDRGQSKVVCV